MFFKENMVLALESLRSNKMRAFLTMLGIIIGIASVIAIISVGDSLSSSITTEMQSIGTNNIRIMVREKDNKFGNPRNRMNNPGSMLSSGASAEDKDLITIEMLEAFQERFKDQVAAISLNESRGTGQVKDERLYANVTVSGVNPGYISVNNVELINGRFINDRDTAGRKSVAVVSDKLVKNIFGSSINPIGQEIKLYETSGIKTYIVVGVYKYTDSDSFFGASSTSEKDAQTSIYIPITLAKQDTTIKNYSSAIIMSKTNVDTDKFTKDIEEYFSKYYETNPKWEVSVINMASQIETASSMLSSVSLAITIIAAISLLVGGIGVMNIMLVSVTERTREIGTRKALGAKNFHIRMQFITEAMIIALVGGLIGLVLGLLLGTLGSNLLGAAPSFSLPTIVLTVAFSMAIGVFFGYYPASKAAQLDPIDALRYE
ncbi:MAG: ABC transporter permease [Clostridiales bacterium GWB2_37_7]|nr:MAG: ABC transporter permease [Clostridiales bacterium GWB2_37_7]